MLPNYSRLIRDNIQKKICDFCNLLKLNCSLPLAFILWSSICLWSSNVLILVATNSFWGFKAMKSKEQKLRKATDVNNFKLDSIMNSATWGPIKVIRSSKFSVSPTFYSYLTVLHCTTFRHFTKLREICISSHSEISRKASRRKCRCTRWWWC